MTIFFYKNDLPVNIDFAGFDAIGIDTETMGLNIHRDRLCLMQISGGDGNAHIIQFEQGNYNAPNLKNVLGRESLTKIFHFARFDLAAISIYLGIEIKNLYCTKIASRLVRTYTDSHGLKSICEELLGVEISKKQQSSDWGNEKISEKQLDYAASDVLYLHRLKEKLDLMLEREGRIELFKKCIDFLPYRVALDISGFPGLDIFAH